MQVIEPPKGSVASEDDSYVWARDSKGNVGDVWLVHTVPIKPSLWQEPWFVGTSHTGVEVPQVLYTCCRVSGYGKPWLLFKKDERIDVIRQDEARSKQQNCPIFWGRIAGRPEGLFYLWHTRLPLPTDDTPAATLPTDDTPATLPPGIPSAWTVKQVVQWLRYKQFREEVCAIFEAHQISGDVLADLDLDDLKEMEITALGDRYRLMRFIDELEGDGVSTPSGSGSSEPVVDRMGQLSKSHDAPPACSD